MTEELERFAQRIAGDAWPQWTRDVWSRANRARGLLIRTDDRHVLLADDLIPDWLHGLSERSVLSPAQSAAPDWFEITGDLLGSPLAFEQPWEDGPSVADLRFVRALLAEHNRTLTVIGSVFWLPEGVFGAALMGAAIADFDSVPDNGRITELLGTDNFPSPFFDDETLTTFSWALG